MKDTFLRSLSGRRFIRLSAIREFRICEADSIPIDAATVRGAYQVVVFFGRAHDEYVVLFKGNEAECKEYIEKTIQTE